MWGWGHGPAVWGRGCRPAVAVPKQGGTGLLSGDHPRMPGFGNGHFFADRGRVPTIRRVTVAAGHHSPFPGGRDCGQPRHPLRPLHPVAPSVPEPRSHQVILT